MLHRIYLAPFLLLLARTNASLNFRGPCDDDPCEEEATDACSYWAEELDFGDCCALSETPSGGCKLTAYNGCVTQTRDFFCGTGSFLADVHCVANHVNIYQDMSDYMNGKGVDASNCPVSEYPLPLPSQYENLYPLKLTHFGLNQSSLVPWENLISGHIRSYLQTHPQLGIRDVRATTSLFTDDFSPQTVGNGDVTVYFLQFLSWRGAESNATFLLDQAFHTNDGKRLYESLFTPAITISELLHMADPEDDDVVILNGTISDEAILDETTLPGAVAVQVSKAALTSESGKGWDGDVVTQVFEYGFETGQARVPTEEEIQSLVCATIRYYEDRWASDSEIANFLMGASEWAYDQASFEPLSVSFHAKAWDASGAEINSVALMNKMTAMDMTTYLNDFVLDAKIQGGQHSLFYYTKEATFNGLTEPSPSDTMKYSLDACVDGGVKPTDAPQTLPDSDGVEQPVTEGEDPASVGPTEAGATTSPGGQEAAPNEATDTASGSKSLFSSVAVLAALAFGFFAI